MKILSCSSIARWLLITKQAWKIRRISLKNFTGSSAPISLEHCSFAPGTAHFLLCIAQRSNILFSAPQSPQLSLSSTAGPTARCPIHHSPEGPLPPLEPAPRVTHGLWAWAMLAEELHSAWDPAQSKVHLSILPTLCPMLLHDSALREQPHVVLHTSSTDEDTLCTHKISRN